ncbi:MAG: hypothetical protein PHT69_17045 [Bacteroidales bacterium]|nr:hypothetical protein [Bacteroidales bacterium]
MGWTYEQQNRLQREVDILNQYFPSFAFVYIGSQLCMEGWLITNSKNNYKIRLYVPKDLPYSVPDVIITYPTQLKDYYGRLLVNLGASANMHLLSPIDNSPKICTYRSTNWNANITFYKVLMKVRIWLEAFDGHLKTSNDLDYYLKHQ